MMRFQLPRLVCHLSLTFLLISCGGANPLFTQGSAISESNSGTEVSEAPTSQRVEPPSESLPSSQSVSQGGTDSDQLLSPPNEVSSIVSGPQKETTELDVKEEKEEKEVKEPTETEDEDNFVDETDDLDEEEISKDFEIIPAKDCCVEQPTAFIQIYLIKNKKRAELRTIRKSCKKVPGWIKKLQEKKKQPFYYFGSCYAKKQRKKEEKKPIYTPGSYRGQSRRR